MILRELVVVDDRPIHLRELARRAGLDAAGVQRELKNLVASGIIIELISGNQKEYRLNPDCPIYPEIRMLVIKTVGLAKLFQDALKPYIKKIKVAFIYGSYAEGTTDADSDIDLMVIGDISFDYVVDALRNTEETISREINPTVYPLNEFSQKAKRKNRFITSVLKGDIIFIVGDRDELGRIVEEKAG